MLVEQINCFNSPTSGSSCSDILSKTSDATVHQTFSLIFSQTTYLVTTLLVEIVFIGNWNGEVINFKLSEKETKNVTSFSNTSHTAGLCSLDNKIDRKIAFSVKISEYESLLQLSVTSPMPYQITSLTAFTFDVCQSNSEFLNSKCVCRAGFYQEFTDLKISSCKKSGYQSAFCFKCSECPPLCTKCQKNPIDDFNIICESCIANPDIILRDGVCTKKNSKFNK